MQDLSIGVPPSRQVATSGVLQGGGNLSADRTLSIVDFPEGKILGRASGAGTGAPSAQDAITFFEALGLSIGAVNFVPVLTDPSPGSAYNFSVPAAALASEGAAYLIFVSGVSGASGNITITWDGTAFGTQAASAGASFAILALVIGDGAGGVKTISQFLGGGNFALGTDTGTGSLTLGFTSATTGSLTAIQVYRLASTSEAASGSPGGLGGSGGGDVLWLPTPYWDFDAQDPDWFTLASTAVTSWFCSGSDNGRIFGQATTANKPIYTGAVNDLTSQVDFDGTNDYLTLTSGPSTHQSGDLTIVFSPDSLSGSPVIFGFAAVASTPYWIIYLSSTGAVDFYSSVGSVNLRTATGLITTGQKNVIRFTSDNFTTRCEVNGVSAALTAVAGSNTGLWFADVAGNTFALGAQVWNSTVTTFFNGKIHQVIYDGSTTTSGGRFLTPSQHRWRKNYLNNRWGLTLPL